MYYKGLLEGLAGHTHHFCLRFVLERGSFGAGGGRAFRGNSQVNKCAGLINVGAKACAVTTQYSSVLLCIIFYYNVLFGTTEYYFTVLLCTTVSVFLLHSTTQCVIITQYSSLLHSTTLSYCVLFCTTE